MNTTWYQRLTGILFIVGAVLVNIPYTLLIMNFDYPDILRESTGHILTRYQEGGTGLIFTWLAFAWVGIPLLFAIVMLQKVLEREDTPYLRVLEELPPESPVAKVKALVRGHLRVIAEELPRATVFFHEWKHLSEALSLRGRNLVLEAVDDF